MKQSQLNQVFTLVRRTGDKVVIMDNESEAVMVLLDLYSYQKLLSGDKNIEEMSEAELMDQINRDIALWRAYNESEQDDFDEWEEPEEPAAHYAKKKSFIFTPAKQFAKNEPAFKPAQGIMQPGKEVVLDDIDFDEEEMDENNFENFKHFEHEALDDDEEPGEEEKFYLEPIE